MFHFMYCWMAITARKTWKMGCRTKFTTSRHRNRCDAHIVAYIAVDFLSEIKCKSQWKRIASQKWISATHIALHTSLVFWSYLKPWNRAIHIAGCQSTSHRRLASRDLANSGVEKRFLTKLVTDYPVLGGYGPLVFFTILWCSPTPTDL